MIGEIIGLISSVVGGMTSNAAADDYTNALEKIKASQRIPLSATKGADILAEQSYRGLPGAEQMKAEVDASVPTTLNQLRDAVSGGQLMEVLSGLYTKANAEKRNINLADQQALQQNRKQYADYLGTTMGGYEFGASQQQTALSLAQVQAKMNASKDKMAYGNQGASELSVDSLMKMLSSGDFSSILALLSKSGGSTKGLNFNSTIPSTADYYDSGL